MASFDSKYSLDPDHVFEGKYRIIRELGSGGFGIVYLAHQLSMDRPVALKILKPGVGAHAPSARERFLREVKIISKLRHPNTVTIHDYGETIDGVVYMVLEYVEGRTLKQVLRQEGAQDPMRALALTRQIARSLAEAHNHGIVHRDLKPANIMLAEIDADADFVKVLDFGVARLLDNNDADLTSAGVPEGERALIGTPRYMSPEQVRGEDLTGASDLYSLGLMFYEMLVGEPAVQGDTTMGLIGQQLSPEPLRLPNLQGLPLSIQQLLRKATDKSIGRRFRVADEFARAIDDTALALGDEMGVSGRAAAGAYFASSGRFTAIPRSSSSQDRHIPIPGQGQDFPVDSTAAATPSSTLRRTTGQARSVGHPHQNRRSQEAGSAEHAQYFEEHFEPDQLARRSMERPAAAGSQASEFPLVRNQVEFDDESDLLGIPSSELPLPPDAGGSPFAPEPAPEPKAQRRSRQPTPVPHQAPSMADDESMVGFGFAVIKICLLSTLAFSFVWVAFIIVAALIGDFTEGKIRLFVAISVAIAIPLFSALGENSQKERFEVVKRPLDRLIRVLIGTTIFSAAVSVIISFAMPGKVTDHLRNDANWFFETTPGVIHEPTPASNLNYQVSNVVADMIEVSTVAIGRYDGTPTTAQDSSTDAPTTSSPPTPTRPRPGATADAPETEAEPEESSEAQAEDPPPPQPTPRTPAPTRPAPSDSEEAGEGDYVRW